MKSYSIWKQFFCFSVTLRPRRVECGIVGNRSRRQLRERQRSPRWTVHVRCRIFRLPVGREIYLVERVFKNKSIERIVRKLGTFYKIIGPWNDRRYGIPPNVELHDAAVRRICFFFFISDVLSILVINCSSLQPNNSSVQRNFPNWKWKSF